MSEDITFELADKLPTYYDAAIAIFKITQNPNRDKMESTIIADHGQKYCALLKIEKISHFYENVHICGLRK